MEQDILSCSPFSATKYHGKNLFCQGRSEAARVEICEANTTRPLMKWIGNHLVFVAECKGVRESRTP